MESSYDLAEIKDGEALLFLETAIENGSGIPEAISDLKMIDSLLQMKKLFFAVNYQTSKTRQGHLRKGSNVYNAMDCIIEGRRRGNI